MLSTRQGLMSIYVLLKVSLLNAMQLEEPPKLTYANELRAQLSQAIKKQRTQDVTHLLLQGAKVKIKSKKQLKKLPPLHLSAISNNPLIIQALLISPQGGPCLEDTFIHKIKRRWRTFLLCLQQLHNVEQFNYWAPPTEVLNHIFFYCLPTPQLLMGHMPLRDLPLYKRCMSDEYKNQLITQLTKRHMNKHRKALLQKVYTSKRNFTPMQIAQAHEYGTAAILLNPRAFGNLKEEIRTGYAKLLE